MRIPSLSRRAVVALAVVPALAAPVAFVSVNADANVNATATSVAAPLIFGHRGASGYRPEHTLASYDLAVRMGADVIEPDLVSTKDHVLVVRHENEISGTTDVASHPEFAARRTTKTVDGSRLTGWFTEDFTLAELRTLRAVERLPAVRQENSILAGRYTVPTFAEVLDYAKRASKEYGREIGVAPETKHPTYFDSIGLSLEEPLVQELRDRNIDKSNKSIYIQSFEEANLRQLHELFEVKVDLVQLTSASGRPYDHVASGDPETYAQMTSAAGLQEVATYADVLGPDKAQVFPRNADGTSGAASAIVTNSHAAGLKVVPYTVRAENQFLPAQYRLGTDPNAFGNVLGEFADLYGSGIDGIFSDQPDLAYTAREDYLGYTHGVTHPQANTPRG